DAGVDAAALGKDVAVTRPALVTVGDIHGLRVGRPQLFERRFFHRVDGELGVGEAAREAGGAADDAVTPSAPTSARAVSRRPSTPPTVTPRSSRSMLTMRAPSITWTPAS